MPVLALQPRKKTNAGARAGKEHAQEGTGRVAAEEETLTRVSQRSCLACNAMLSLRTASAANSAQASLVRERAPTPVFEQQACTPTTAAHATLGHAPHALAALPGPACEEKETDALIQRTVASSSSS